MLRGFKPHLLHFCDLFCIFFHLEPSFIYNQLDSLYFQHTRAQGCQLASVSGDIREDSPFGAPKMGYFPPAGMGMRIKVSPKALRGRGWRKYPPPRGVPVPNKIA